MLGGFTRSLSALVHFTLHTGAGVDSVVSSHKMMRRHCDNNLLLNQPHENDVAISSHSNGSSGEIANTQSATSGCVVDAE